MCTKKGIDDLVTDPRYQAVEKRVQETKLQQMICFDNACSENHPSLVGDSKSTLNYP